jgi:hypothetical protein
MTSHQFHGSLTLVDAGSSNLLGRGDLIVARNLRAWPQLGTETASASTGSLTAANLVNGIVTAGNVTITTPTAAAIVAAVSLPRVGDVLKVLFSNTGGGATTFSAGSGVTLTATGMSIATNNARYVYFRFTNVTSGTEAVTVY